MASTGQPTVAKVKFYYLNCLERFYLFGLWVSERTCQCLISRKNSLLGRFLPDYRAEVSRRTLKLLCGILPADSGSGLPVSGRVRSSNLKPVQAFAKTSEIYAQSHHKQSQRSTRADWASVVVISGGLTSANCSSRRGRLRRERGSIKTLTSKTANPECEMMGLFMIYSEDCHSGKTNRSTKCASPETIRPASALRHRLRTAKSTFRIQS